MSDASFRISRRGFLNFTALGAASVAASACTTTGPAPEPAQPPPPAYVDPPLGDYETMYGATSDNGFDLPAIPVNKIDHQFLRQIVPDPTGQRPGTIVVDTTNHFLYLVREGGQAIRYGVGLGRAGFEWSGDAVVQWKQKWPKWTPPDEMVARQPELTQYSAKNGGMPGGLKNPLGARALYLFQGDQDTLYRLHGSPEWWSIGKSVSSGCVRLINQDIVDLYDRVPSKTPVIVTADIGAPVADVPDRRAIPIDAGVPTGSILLGPVKRLTNEIF
ncbi:L,D-transpeptidase [Mesorhizobium sp. M4A.F.Ca.ET.020.02.1.1]|uniref:L,D-transpeptidase n=1 Tax=unclassified Mesorhizobium TaxID=325217 RepID=UPI000FD252AD|nr:MULTISPECIES: L,D-transpeptidase [unclassified Mesorhizobium]RVD44564.1 L,D-transpeptidase [Mesorhizobium sp. M4A.F.Ca.ET.020.02.1.1]RWC22325.1 MAG: L,D-transpeptidase [Mesorhizobium sp.]RWD26734.1 MAG: L,D-transpeptidase [Mesorhizobium sp.]RWD31706.1 MAG: L,D-transpeptidase [Mesorhizobium sp.]TIW28912.1 MAG: L,D-transpeptidase [Mesorhizobium sp.]